MSPEPELVGLGTGKTAVVGEQIWPVTVEIETVVRTLVTRDVLVMTE